MVDGGVQPRDGSNGRAVSGGPGAATNADGLQRAANDAASARATSAQTLPPNPAPKLHDAKAPWARADRASSLVSGTWLPSSSSASACDPAASSPSRAASTARNASSACGARASSRMK